MSQYLAMLPSQQMRLEQRLTPQLIQSMEILQLPLLALEARIREELELNPVLEEQEDPTASQEVAQPAEDQPQTEESQAEAESFERLDRMSRELEFDPGDLPYGRGSREPSGERDAKLDAMANTAARGESLSEHLRHQWALVDVDEAVRSAGEAIIDWMDDDGYLRREGEHRPRRDNGKTVFTTPLTICRNDEDVERLMEEIASSRTPAIDMDVLDEALASVQSLEPTGVGGRDLVECLLIQLDARSDTEPLHGELVRSHLENLAKNRFPAIAKATEKSIEEIKAALLLISKLNHHPGLIIRPNDVPRVSPDIMVDYADEGDGYTIRLTRGSSPRLRISAHYRRILEDKTGDKKVRDFIRSRVEAAGAIIDAIHYRRERLLELAKVVVDRQREFFDYGPQHLKVLRMRDLAEEFECDPSTISRTVDGKYLQAPRGIYPLRMFFTGGTSDESGKSVSWDSLKAKVKEIISQEDKSDPMSDDEIVKKLSETSVPIARRTVAKYRAQLNIPSARQRRRY